MSVESSESTRATVGELLGRMVAGDPERVAELFAERTDWRLSWPEAEHGREATPWIRHRSTPADAVDHFRMLAEHHIPEKVGTEVERILVEGEDAVVLGRIRQTARSTGRAYEAPFALHLTVEGGLITRYHIYEDSLAVAQAFA